MNFELLKITSHTVFHQRFELGTIGSEIQGSSTELSWDLYVKGGDNVVNAEGRPNEIGQSWCLADLLDFQLVTTGTSQGPPIDPMQTHVAYLQQHILWILFTVAHWVSLVNTL